MKKIEKYVAKNLVKTVSVLTKFLAIKKNKVSYISYKSNELPLDMKLIREELLNKEMVEENFLLMKMENKFSDKVKYFIQIIKQVHAINTSKVVVIDANNFVVSNMTKKDETKIIQIWHATGAIKKFGCDVERDYEIKNYDYILTSSSKSIDRMASAFGVEKSKISPIGIAGTDILFDEKKMLNYKKEMLSKYPEINGKKVILYAPTFRGKGIFENKFIDINLENILNNLSDEYVVVYKLHPIIAKMNLGKNKSLINMSDEEIYKVFSITDIFISDYSSIIYDFTILEKPMIFYVPDIDEYVAERGFYDDYEVVMPGKCVKCEEDLINVIKNEDFYIDDVKNLKQSFFDFKDGKASERIADLIVKLMKN